VLLGSASDEAAARRDEWSDHDFFALIASGRGPEVRPNFSARLGWQLRDSAMAAEGSS
jgi:hypothetical protein